MGFFSPAEVAKNYIAIGKGKVNLSISKMFILGIMAGVFIAFGGVGCTTISSSISLPSVAKFVGAAVFPGGLTMVLCAGSELFTGNCLLVIPLAEKEITWKQMLKSWIVVYIANFIGAALVAAGVVYSHQPGLFSNGLAVSVISTAAAKASMSFGDAFIRGILCNFLVCIAVWIAFAAKDIAGKIIGLFFPIMMFVGCGFEHSIANMYFLLAGVFATKVDTFAQAAANAGVDMSMVNAGGVAANLIPVTLGNIVGGSVCVGLAYWYCYLRKDKEKESNQ